MTAMSGELFLALIAFMGAQISLIEAHSNTVAVAGKEVTMKCQTYSGNCNGVEWKKKNAQASQPEMRIFRNNEILNDYRGHYSVDNSSGCNLLIRNVSLTDAGRFGCEYIKESNTVNELSLLIVLESLPKCSVKVNASSEGIAAEGDGIEFTCEVKFNAIEGASMTWKNLDNVSTSVKPGTTRLLHSVVAKRYEIPSFECITTFDLPKNVIGLASNIPTLPSCTAELNMTLLYQVTNVSLTPSSVYSIGSTITCSAIGNPPPSYKWQNADANGINETWTDIEAGETFKPSMTTRYNGTVFRCVANNTIRGKSFVAFSRMFQVNDKSGDSGSVSTTTGQNKGPSFPLIPIIASAAGVVALLIVIVIICICRVRSNEKKNKSGNDKSSNGDQIPLKPTPNINGSINPQMTTVPVASVQPQSRGEAGKRPQIPTPEPKKPIPAPEPKKQIPAPGPKKHKDDAKKKRPDPPPQKEEVLYADLAMEQGPTRRLEQQAPAYDPHAVYADVQLA